jgi:hypothetical protein
LDSRRAASEVGNLAKSVSLGVGELSTLLLAMEIAADVALMDERRARLLAKAEGVPVLGTVGLLEFGYRRGELADLRQVYQMLLAQGAHIDRQILDQSLAHFNLPAFDQTYEYYVATKETDSQCRVGKESASLPTFMVGFAPASPTLHLLGCAVLQETPCVFGRNPCLRVTVVMLPLDWWFSEEAKLKKETGQFLTAQCL